MRVDREVALIYKAYARGDTLRYECIGSGAYKITYRHDIENYATYLLAQARCTKYSREDVIKIIREDPYCDNEYHSILKPQ